MRFMFFAFFMMFGLTSVSADMVTQDMAQKWNVSYNASTLTFAGKQMAAPFNGVVQKYTAEVYFDPEDLARSHVAIDIDISSLATGDKDRDQTMHATEWFDTSNFATARFVAATFNKTENDSYEAHGNLTIKDHTVPVVLSFTLEFPETDSGNKKAIVKGTATLDRSKFSLGLGDWADVSVIANEVDVSFNLVAFIPTVK